MSMTQVVAHHLPALRRYARALTGSQSSGDANIAAMLEAISSDSDVLHEDNAKVGLFRLFTKTWNSLASNATPQLTSVGVRGDRRIAQLTPKPRQAFLLVSLEAFSERDAAEILDVTVPDLERLLEQAGRELASEIASDVLIIEDEPLIAYDLQELVESLGHHVVGIARTHAEAVILARARLPELILADIKLGDGSSGIEAVSELLTELCVPVVFITAFPERVLTGQRVEPTFLIAKPFQPAAVAAVISQALFFECNAAHISDSDATVHQKKMQEPSLFLQLLNAR